MRNLTLGTLLLMLLLGLNASSWARTSTASVRQSPATSQVYLPLVMHRFSSQTLTFTPATGDVPNPERGFYRWLNDFTPAALADYAAQGYRLGYQREILRDYLQRDLTTTYLDALATRLQAVRQAGLQVILRFSYNEGETQPAPDASLSQVVRHIEQLAPVLSTHRDVIAWIEAGFIGAWGEWHSSASGLDTPTNKENIRDALFTHFPSDRALLFRYPGDFISWYPQPLTAEQAFTTTPQARLGHHNDCFLASDDDEGTYRDASTGENRASEWQAYLAQMTRFVPLSGETCRLNPPRSDCTTALNELAMLHWSALNHDWHPDVIQTWRDQGCYEEIRQRLGYRLTLRTLTFSPYAYAGDQVWVQLRLENTGFAAPRLARPVYLILASQGRILRHRLDVEPRRWEPGEHTIYATLPLPADLPRGDYRLALWLPAASATLQADPRYAIRLANENLWDAEQGWNWLANVHIER